MSVHQIIARRYMYIPYVKKKNLGQYFLCHNFGMVSCEQRTKKKKKKVVYLYKNNRSLVTVYHIELL